MSWGSAWSRGEVGSSGMAELIFCVDCKGFPLSSPLVACRARREDSSWVRSPPPPLSFSSGAGEGLSRSGWTLSR